MSVRRAMARSLGRQRWFCRIARRLVPLDLAVQQRTNGRASMLRLAGQPYLVLTTTGRRSGRLRSVPLLYLPRESGFVVAGSNWGRRDHPDWSANLLSNPEALVRERGHEVPVRARLATGPERSRLWREITEAWPAYDDYDRRCGNREIRVFVLTPR